MSRAAAAVGSDRAADRAALGTGAVIGVALMGAVDEIVFHQLLQWHSFYVHTGPFWRTFSDGLFHAFTATLWLAGALLLWYRRRSLAAVASDRRFWAGLLLGAGAFQLFDGTIDHKLLALHPVRVGADPIWPYDAAWIGSALLLLFEGWVLLRLARRAAPVPRRD